MQSYSDLCELSDKIVNNRYGVYAQCIGIFSPLSRIVCSRNVLESTTLNYVFAEYVWIYQIYWCWLI